MFIPRKENQNTGTVMSFKENLDAIASGKLANQLNEKVKTVCADHPCVKTVVSVSLEPQVNFQIESCCCEEFRDHVEGLLND